MKSLTGYRKEGGNKHDDAPDGLTILAEYIEYLGLMTAKNQNQKLSKEGMGFF